MHDPPARGLPGCQAQAASVLELFNRDCRHSRGRPPAPLQLECHRHGCCGLKETDNWVTQPASPTRRYDQCT